MMINLRARTRPHTHTAASDGRNTAPIHYLQMNFVQNIVRATSFSDDVLLLPLTPGGLICAGHATSSEWDQLRHRVM